MNGPGFLDFDAHLTTSGAVEELRRLAGQEEASEGGAADGDDSADERRLLVEEARMPIEKLFEQYGILGKMEDGSAFISPNLSRRRKKSKKNAEVSKLVRILFTFK